MPKRIRRLVGLAALTAAAVVLAGPSARATMYTPLFQTEYEAGLDQFDRDGDELSELRGMSDQGPKASIWNPFSLSTTSGCIGSACIYSGCLLSGCGGTGCIGSACLSSGCAGSLCGTSECGGSACVGSLCAGSLCAGSACVGSACAGSACGGSLCGGSLCSGSGCIGSACWISGCAGSLCAGSGCYISICVGTACAGSGCYNSQCAISFCIESQCGGSVCYGASGCYSNPYCTENVGLSDGHSPVLVAARSGDDLRLGVAVDGVYRVTYRDASGRDYERSVTCTADRVVKIPLGPDSQLRGVRLVGRG